MRRRQICPGIAVIKKELGFEPKISIREGVERVIKKLNRKLKQTKISRINKCISRLLKDSIVYFLHNRLKSARKSVTKKRRIVMALLLLEGRDSALQENPYVNIHRHT